MVTVSAHFMDWTDLPAVNNEDSVLLKNITLNISGSGGCDDISSGYSCLNGGVCSINKTCICKDGYDGTTCANCIILVVREF